MASSREHDGIIYRIRQSPLFPMGTPQQKTSSLSYVATKIKIRLRKIGPVFRKYH